MMEVLILNDGTELNGHILPNGDGQIIFVYLDNMSLFDGVMMFSDTAKTMKITEQNHGEEHIYEGFTEIWSVSHEYGNCNIAMRKGGNDA